ARPTFSGRSPGPGFARRLKGIDLAAPEKIEAHLRIPPHSVALLSGGSHAPVRSEPMRERDLFIEALQKADAADRLAYLNAACTGAAAPRDRVVRLLAEHEKQESFLLAAPPAVAVAQTIDLPAGESPGTVIGPYKLIEPIGEGGMGAVWMAQRTEPV